MTKASFLLAPNIPQEQLVGVGHTPHGVFELDGSLAYTRAQIWSPQLGIKSKIKGGLWGRVGRDDAPEVDKHMEDESRAGCESMCSGCYNRGPRRRFGARQ